MSNYRKAIAALVTPVVIWVALKVGLNLDADTTAAIIAVITGIVVERIPNT